MFLQLEKRPEEWPGSTARPNRPYKKTFGQHVGTILLFTLKNYAIVFPKIFSFSSQGLFEEKDVLHSVFKRRYTEGEKGVYSHNPKKANFRWHFKNR